MTEMFFARPQCNHDHSGILHKNEKGCAQFYVLACVLLGYSKNVIQYYIIGHGNSQFTPIQ